MIKGCCVIDWQKSENNNIIVRILDEKIKAQSIIERNSKSKTKRTLNLIIKEDGGAFVTSKTFSLFLKE